MNPLHIVIGLILLSAILVTSAAFIGGHINLPTAAPASMPTTSSTPVASDLIPKSEEKPGEYINTLYGFAFSYPTSQTLETFAGTDLLDLLLTPGNVSIGVPKMYFRENAKSMEEAVKIYLSAMCEDASPMNAPSSCSPKSMQVSPFVSSSGAKGLRIVMQRVMDQFVPEKKTTRTGETAYVFPIDVTDAFCVVLFPDMSTKGQPDALKSIADSFRFIPRE